MEKFKFLLKNKISKLPKNPGVYGFKSGGEVLYIGKAANIRERVRNHPQILGKAQRIGFIETDSEIEALILEADLIKKYQPKFNVMWRDDKNYFYVGITKENYPRIFLTHQPQKKLEIGLVGPFVDGKSLKQTLRTLRKVFPYRSCRILPKRPCLWYQLDRCPAPCQLKTNLGTQLISWKTKMKKECQRNTKNLLKVLKGKKKQALKDLKKEMRRAAKKENFEEAVEIRNQIFALEKVIAHTKIIEPQKEVDWGKVQRILKKIIKKKVSRIEAYDISNIQGQQATGSMVTFIKGRADKNFYRKFRIHPVKSSKAGARPIKLPLAKFNGAEQFNRVKIAQKPNDTAMLKEVLKRRFGHPEWLFPDLILIDGGIAQLNAALKIKNQISKIKKIKVIALAKKKNELYIEGKKKPILLKKLPREVFNLILQLRDEAHRFARAYHHRLREIDLLPKS